MLDVRCKDGYNWPHAEVVIIVIVVVVEVSIRVNVPYVISIVRRARPEY